MKPVKISFASAHIIAAVVLLGCIGLICVAIEEYQFFRSGSRQPTYESGFHDSINVYFPPGHDPSGAESAPARIDRRLRAEKLGYMSGVMSGNDGIDFLTIDTDFTRMNEAKYVEDLLREGILPADVTVEFSPDAYGLR